MNLINHLLLTAFLFCSVVMLVTAMYAPSFFGAWLQTIDNARFEYTQCN